MQLVPPSGKMDERYASSLILAHVLHYANTRRHPQNRQRRMNSQPEVTRTQNLSVIWTVFLRYMQADRQTDRHADCNTLHSYRGRSKKHSYGHLTSAGL